MHDEPLICAGFYPLIYAGFSSVLLLRHPERRSAGGYFRNSSSIWWSASGRELQASVLQVDMQTWTGVPLSRCRPMMHIGLGR